MFRKFHDEHPSDEATDEEDETSADDRQLLRQAGPDARRPLTRSSVKPKLLFQAEIKQRKLDNGEVTEDEDEEESTDVELPIATPSRGNVLRSLGIRRASLTPYYPFANKPAAPTSAWSAPRACRLSPIPHFQKTAQRWPEP